MIDITQLQNTAKHYRIDAIFNEKNPIWLSVWSQVPSIYGNSKSANKSKPLITQRVNNAAGYAANGSLWRSSNAE